MGANDFMIGDLQHVVLHIQQVLVSADAKAGGIARRPLPDVLRQFLLRCRVEGHEGFIEKDPFGFADKGQYQRKLFEHAAGVASKLAVEVMFHSETVGQEGHRVGK